eukprot:1555188-Rhodomonas_salina.1
MRDRGRVKEEEGREEVREGTGGREGKSTHEAWTLSFAVLRSVSSSPPLLPPCSTDLKAEAYCSCPVAGPCSPFGWEEMRGGRELSPGNRRGRLWSERGVCSTKIRKPFCTDLAQQ